MNTTGLRKQTLYVFGVLLSVFNGSFGEKIYRMEGFCNGKLKFSTENIYQAKLKFADDKLFDKKEPSYPYQRIGYCEATLESGLPFFSKFMFYFEDLNLDCEKGHLEFYAGTRSLRVNGLSREVCGLVKPVGVFKIEYSVLRIRYVPKSSQVIPDVFTLIITSFGDDYCPSEGHECGNSRCIHEDIACNGYNSCGDGTGCNLGTGTIVLIVIGSIVGACFFITTVVALVCCFISCRKRNKSTNTVQNNTSATHEETNIDQHMTSQPMYKVTQGLTYSANMTTYPQSTISISGNPDYNVQSNAGYALRTNDKVPSNSPSEDTSGLLDASAPPPSYEDVIRNATKNLSQNDII